MHSSSRLLGGGVPGLGEFVPGGACSWGVSLVLGGAWSRGGGIPTCTEADTPPRGQTHTCKNITFALRCGR